MKRSKLILVSCSSSHEQKMLVGSDQRVYWYEESFDPLLISV
jgi:hypothetical protein